MQIFNYNNSYKKLLEDKEKEPYLFPDYEGQLDIMYKQKSLIFQLSDTNTLFQEFAKDNIDLDEDVRYYIKWEEEDNIIELYEFDNPDEDYYEFIYTESVHTEEDFTNNIFYHYFKECISLLEMLPFDAQEYVPDKYKEEVETVLDVEDNFETFDKYSVDDLISDYYTNHVFVYSRWGGQGRGLLTSDYVDKFLEIGLNDNIVNEEDYNLITTNLNDNIYTTIKESINSYTYVTHWDDPNVHSNDSNYIFLDLENNDSYDYEVSIDNWNVKKIEFSEKWLLYSNYKELSYRLQTAYELLKNEENVENVNCTFSIKAYMSKENYLEIINDIKNEISNQEDGNDDYYSKSNNAIKSFLSSERNPVKNDIKSFEKKIQYIDSPDLYRVAMVLGKELDYDINKKVSIPELRKLGKNNNELNIFLKRKDIEDLIKTYSSGFTIKDIIKSNIATKKKGSIFQYFDDKGMSESDYLSLSVGQYKWRSHLQRIFSKYNYVFQLNLKKEYLNEILRDFNIQDKKSILARYFIIDYSVHPVQNNDKYITLGWIRYTITPEYEGEIINGVVLDEVQSDLNNQKYLGRTLMGGWQYIILKKFISYIRKNLGYDKVYMPTLGLKNRPSSQGGYGANVPEFTGKSLYIDLPQEIGFKKSQYDDFVLLEKILH